MGAAHQALAALSLLASAAWAQTNPGGGSAWFGECRAGYWSGNRNLDERENIAKATCLAQWRYSTPGLNSAASLRLGAADHTTTRSANAELREAYLDWQPAGWSLRAGRQLLAWGRADRFNPSDYLSARDFTLLVPEDEEQRLGADALQVRRFFTPGLSLAAVATRFRPNVLPRGSLPPNLVDADRPRRVMGALKLESVGTGLDWSISAFDGYAASPIYHVGPAGPGGFVFQAEHERVRALGADAAWALGRWNLRAEAAAYRSSASCASCPQQQRDSVRAVIGVDTDLGDSANINVQLFSIGRSGYRSPSELPAEQRALALALQRLNSEYARRETGLTLRLSNRWFNDRLRAELGAIIDLSKHSQLWRPRVSYGFSDGIKLSAGADLFSGPAQSFFGSRKDNRLGLAELALIF